MIEMEKSDIVKAILRSQRCQRNWDLSRDIPPEDIEIIRAAVTQCPSKQNISFYRSVFVTDRDLIHQIHDASMLAGVVDAESRKYRHTTQSQLLANLLVILIEDYDVEHLERTPSMMVHHGHVLPKELVDQHIQYYANDMDLMMYRFEEDYKRDQATAVGIAAGYMNLTASLLGYSTGCCQCFDQMAMRKILNTDKQILLIMGIGYKDDQRNRREHHLYPNSIFPTMDKQIEVEMI